jgi:hypothetical protein
MSLDSYYAMTAAKRNGTNADDEMEKLGYIKEYYIGSGAWHWKKSNNEEKR